MRMADLMSYIHRHLEDANPDIMFDDVLNAFAVAMPATFSAGEYEAFAAACRAHVPAYYSTVNDPERY